MSAGVGELRWVMWGDKFEWHLRFGLAGLTLCDRWPTPSSQLHRALKDGPPADRCPKCSEVIRYRLGLSA